MHLRLSRMLLAVAASTLLVLAGLGSPATAATKAPVVTASASVSQFDATFNYTVNVKASSITAQVCTLTNTGTQQPTVIPCDLTANKGSTGTLSKFALTQRIIAAGPYSFQVAITVKGVVAPATAATSFSILPGPAAHFDVSGLIDQNHGFPSQLFTVKALDQYGNLATNYHGTVKFTGGDLSYVDTTHPQVLPSDSTLTNGQGVFTMNAGGLQGDCNYPDIAIPACDNHERVTATDTQDPTITGYQRFATNIIIPNPNYWYAAPAPTDPVCTDCVVDPSGLQISTTTTVLATVTGLSPIDGQVTWSFAGKTVQGGSFTQVVTTAPLVGAPNSASGLSGVLVSPQLGQTINVNLSIGLPGDVSFGNYVTVDLPYLNLQSTTVLTNSTEVTHLLPPQCPDGGDLTNGCSA